MLRTVESFDDVVDFFSWLSEQSIVAFDTETSGKDTFAYGFRVRLIQFGNTREAWVLDFNRWRGLVEEVFKKFRGEWIAHNSNYDIHALHREGIEVPWHRVHDTMIALRLSQPNMQAGLKPASDRLIGPGASGSQQDLHEAFRKNDWDWDSVPIDFPTYIFYAGMDVILTSRLFKHPTVQRGIDSPVYELEMQVRAIANLMERNGMRIDRDYSSSMSRRLRAEADALRTEVSDEYGFSPGSTSILGRWFLENAPGLVKKTTDAGAPSTDKETLEYIESFGDERASRLARKVLRVRRTEKLASSYFDNFVTLSDASDILHADIETLAARTGRMSIRKPGLQTLPRVSSDPETKIVRRAVLPREEGHVLISCDSSQIELRLAAALSNDAAMMTAFEESDDFFTTLMREIYDDPSAQKSDPRRAAVKTTLYAKTYGAGPAKIALSAGVSVERIRELLNGLASAYPDYTNLGERYEREAHANEGWVTNPYGRRLKVDEGKEYTATNYCLQSCAADVLKQSIINLGHAGLEDYLVVPVHDEMVLSVPAEDAEEISRTVQELMTCRDFPLTLTASAGPPALNWAEAK